MPYILLNIFGFASVFSLGLLASSLLVEATILVPFWRRMDAGEFFEKHHEMGPYLYRYFTPVTIAGTLLPVVFAVLNLALKGDNIVFWWAIAILSSSLMVIYFAYFKAANQSFADHSITEEQLPSVLQKWQFMHNIRTMLALVAFGLGLFIIIFR